MIGGIEETSASFEARYAPRSYPTEEIPMEDIGFDRSDAPSYRSNRPGAAWRDLREWLDLIERAG